MKNKIIALTLIISLLLTSVVHAGILGSVTQGYGGDAITSDRFRLAADTSSQGLYGSRYVINVSSTNQEPYDYSIAWGGEVFLRNSPVNYNKDIYDYNWLMGIPASSSMDYNDNGAWLTSRFKRNWSAGDAFQIVPTDPEIDAIINQIWNKTSDKTRFGDITKEDLLERRYTFQIIMESMVLVNLSSGTSLNGKTWDSNDSVWVTYNEFNELAEMLAADCKGDTTKLNQLKAKLAPLYVLFSKPNKINGTEYLGNMAISLHCEGIYEGWGWHEVKANNPYPDYQAAVPLYVFMPRLLI